MNTMTVNRWIIRFDVSGDNCFVVQSVIRDSENHPIINPMIGTEINGDTFAAILTNCYINA